MLDNIKIMLELTDNKYDDMIMLYLSKVETVVVAYCNIKSIDDSLKSFIEDKVVNIMKVRLGKMDVKSINRGDTSITYNVASASEYSNSPNLTESEKKFLNTYRKVRCF